MKPHFSMAWKCEIEMTQKNKFNGILEEDFQVNPKTP